MRGSNNSRGGEGEAQQITALLFFKATKRVSAPIREAVNTVL